MALFPAELAKQGAQRGQSEADAALLSRTCRSSASSATTTSGPTSRRAALLANCASLVIPRERPLVALQSGAPDGPAASRPRARARRKQGVRADREDDARAGGVARPAGGEYEGFTQHAEKTRIHRIARYSAH